MRMNTQMKNKVIKVFKCRNRRHSSFYIETDKKNLKKEYYCPICKGRMIESDLNCLKGIITKIESNIR